MSKGRRALQLPEGYVHGQDKHWFTASTFINKPYLLALVSAGDLSAQGLTMVPHGKDKRVYEAILKGDFDWRKVAASSRRRGAITVDVDQDDAVDAPALRDASEEPLAIEDGGGGGDTDADDDVQAEGHVSSVEDEEGQVVVEALANDELRDDDMVRALAAGGKWGAFSISWAIPSARRPYGFQEKKRGRRDRASHNKKQQRIIGGYHASCPFHRKKKKPSVKCTKCPGVHGICVDMSYAFVSP